MRAQAAALAWSPVEPLASALVEPLASAPVAALASGPRGLDDLTRLIHDAPRVLRPGGWICLEHGMEQAGDVRRLLNDVGFVNISTSLDLAGLERVSSARKPA